MNMVRHVDAIFGGRPVRFRFSAPRELMIPLHYAVALQSPFATFQRFVSGLWTMDDLRTVLSVSYEGRGLVFRQVDEVETVLRREPPARYAPLAARILEAFLLGVEERLAVFDEANPFGVTEPEKVA